jgi:hypothetical protein
MTIGERWCRTMHSEISWPKKGRYRCLQCHRVYAIVWLDDGALKAVPAIGNAEAGWRVWWQRWLGKVQGLVTLQGVPFRSSRASGHFRT